MSRSFKKHAIIKIAPRDGTNEKRFANQKVRRCTNPIANGKAYRKIYESYDIHDYICGKNYEEYRKDDETALKIYLNGGISYNLYNFKHSYVHWYKTYKRK